MPRDRRVNFCSRGFTPVRPSGRRVNSGFSRARLGVVVFIRAGVGSLGLASESLDVSVGSPARA